MSETSDNLSLPYILPQQAQKHVTHNEAIRMLDALVQLSVVGMANTVAPEDPGPGERHLVAVGAQGPWASHDNKLAVWQDGAWAFIEPATGWTAIREDTGDLLWFDGVQWAPLAAGQSESVSKLGVNATADTVNRLSVTSAGALFNHDGDSHRVVVNKNAAVDTASFVFQSGWTGHAELGLTGNNDLSIKTSANGTDWTSALKIDAATGNVGIGVDPAAHFHVSGGDVQIGWNLINAVAGNGGAAMEVMGAGSGDRFAYFDFHASDLWTGYSARVIRNMGENGAFLLANRGTGGVELRAENEGSIRFATQSAERMRVDSTGKVGIGTANPTATLHVDGVMRLKPMTTSQLPSAASVGEGAIAYVTDKPGGAGLMASNGAAWQ